MKRLSSIRFKAAFLLIVFALNTLVGFACSVGVDMGFNSDHHPTKNGTGTVHVHKDGKRHVHKPGTAIRHHDKTAGTKKDGCCKEKVVKLQSADKSFQYSKTIVSAPVYILPKNNIRTAIVAPAAPDLQKYDACHFHPPPRDIRIAIQSFQI